MRRASAECSFSSSAFWAMVVAGLPRPRRTTRARKPTTLRDAIIRNSRSEFCSASQVTSHFFLKRWRRIYPQQPGLGTSGILPAVRRRALKIEAVSRLEPVMLFAIQPNFKIAAKYMQELLAFVRVGFAAAAAGFDPKKMGFHCRLAPGEELHAHAGSGLENFSLAWPHEPRIFRGGFKERKNIGAVEARDAAQRGDGGAHLAAFERAEKADGNFRGARHLREGEAAAR